MSSDNVINPFFHLHFGVKWGQDWVSPGCPNGVEGVALLTLFDIVCSNPLQVSVLYGYGTVDVN